MQVELSGPGTLSLALEATSGPAMPRLYAQAVNYVKGHAGIVVTGADERTNVSIFRVGRAAAVNEKLFKDVIYDGIADIAYTTILSSNGKFGGLPAARKLLGRAWSKPSSLRGLA